MIQTEMENPLTALAYYGQEDSLADSRKHFSTEQKIAILRRRLLEQVPVSDLCDEYSIQPSVFYRWQQQLFESGAAACVPQANLVLCKAVSLAGEALDSHSERACVAIRSLVYVSRYM